MNPKPPLFTAKFLPRHFSARFVFFIPIVPSLKLDLAVRDQTTENAAFPSGRIPFRQSINFSTLEEEMLCPRRCCASWRPLCSLQSLLVCVRTCNLSSRLLESLGVGIKEASGIQVPLCGGQPLVPCCLLPHTMYSGNAHSFQPLTQKIPAKFSSGTCSSWEPARAQVHLQSSICDDCSDRRLFKDSVREKRSFSCRFQKTSSVGLSTRKCAWLRDRAGFRCAWSWSSHNVIKTCHYSFPLLLTPLGLIPGWTLHMASASYTREDDSGFPVVRLKIMA